MVELAHGGHALLSVQLLGGHWGVHDLGLDLEAFLVLAHGGPPLSLAVALTAEARGG